MLLEVTGPEPPVPGLTTVTATVPAVATNVSGTVADRMPLLRKLVVTAVPLSWIVDPETNACPLTCRENAAAPAITLDGLSEVMLATGTG